MKTKFLVIIMLAYILVFTTAGVTAAKNGNDHEADALFEALLEEPVEAESSVIVPQGFSSYAKVAYIYMNGANATSAKVWVRPLTTLPTTQWNFTTNNARYIDMLSDCLDNRTTIYFRGSLDTPAANGYVGTLMQLRKYKNR